MKLKFLGQACFMITSDDGVRIITDPYSSGGRALKYDKIEESADVITVSHEHPDHNNVAGIAGNPTVVRGVGLNKAKGIDFKGISSYHDDEEGSKRGSNTIFCFTIDGIRICHTGDLGHQLSDKQLAEAGQVDVLIIGVGGKMLLDLEGATRVREQMKPAIFIPMHYRTEKAAFFLIGVDEILAAIPDARKLGSSELVLNKSDLPKTTEVIIMEHAL